MTVVRRETKAGATRWEVRVRQPGGREVSRTFRTRDEAKRFERDFLARRDRGDVLDPSAGRVLFGDYAATVLAGRRLGAKTRHEYEAVLRRRILPTFARTPLVGITTEAVQAWHTEMVEQVPGEGAKAFRILSMVLRTAVDAGRLSRNPCAAVRGGGVERSPERPLLDVDQVVALADAMPERLRALVLLAGFGGLRRGELLALRRRHYDPLHQRLHVVEAMTTFSGRRVAVEPKAGSRREVALPGPLAEVLEHHLAAYVGPEPDSPVFTGERSGQPLSTRSLYNAWAEARRAVGLPGVHLHDLRHAAGTLRAQLGATMREVMADLGHRTPAMALRYQHAAERRRREVADKVGTAMRSAVPTRPAPLDPLAGRTRDGRAREAESRLPAGRKTGSDLG